MSEEYNIKDSIPKVGHLYPILKDAHGNVIDGDHRLIEDPDWPVQTLEHIKTHEQLVMARIIANICRRTIPFAEKSKWLRQIAELTEWTPKQIAENLPVTYSWVMKYIPNEFKERPGQGPKEYPVSRRVTEKPLVECSRCHMATSEATSYKNEELCPKCLVKAKHKPEKLVHKPKPRVTTSITKPKESWAHRKAVMSQPVSKMDEAILLRLQGDEQLRKEGWKITFQKPYCIVEIKSDVTLENQRLGREIAVFHDGEHVHGNRKERDQANREKAAYRNNIEILPVPYERYSKLEEDRIYQDIVEAVK